MRDITFHHRAHENEDYKTPKVDVKWWYVSGEEAGLDYDGVPTEGYPEGVCLSLQGKNHDWSLVISAGTLVEMVRTVELRAE